MASFRGVHSRHARRCARSGECLYNCARLRAGARGFAACGFDRAPRCVAAVRAKRCALPGGTDATAKRPCNPAGICAAGSACGCALALWCAARVLRRPLGLLAPVFCGRLLGRRLTARRGRGAYEQDDHRRHKMRRMPKRMPRPSLWGQCRVQRWSSRLQHETQSPSAALALGDVWGGNGRVCVGMGAGRMSASERLAACGASGRARAAPLGSIRRAVIRTALPGRCGRGRPVAVQDVPATTVWGAASYGVRPRGRMTRSRTPCNLEMATP